MILLINANQGKIAQYFLARSLVTSLVIRLKGPWLLSAQAICAIVILDSKPSGLNTKLLQILRHRFI